MELREFIKETIIQITDGIKDGHQYIVENEYGEGVRMDKAKEVAFDVAVATNEGESAETGGKISVAHLFQLGSSGQETSSSTNTSRIQFKVLIHIRT